MTDKLPKAQTEKQFIEEKYFPYVPNQSFRVADTNTLYTVASVKARETAIAERLKIIEKMLFYDDKYDILEVRKEIDVLIKEIEGDRMSNCVRCNKECEEKGTRYCNQCAFNLRTRR